MLIKLTELGNVEEMFRKCLGIVRLLNDMAWSLFIPPDKCALVFMCELSNSEKKNPFLQLNLCTFSL